ncbi:MAG: hypothetical protein Q8N17_26020 [Burkholderiaceae bacterium]|nr:hypothetical protein [Burkholderiaceae bacterium]
MTTSRDNKCLTSAGLAEGTGANTFQIVRAFDALIAGRAVRKAAADSIAFAAHTGTTFTSLAAGQMTAYFFMMNAAGTVTQIQSSVVANPAGATYVPGVWEWPDRDGFVCIGALTVRTNGAAVFVPGTTDLGAADVVDVFYDALPDVTAKPLAY